MKNLVITASELEHILNIHARKGARPASVRLACPVKLLKKSRLTGAPCALGTVIKLTHLSVLVNFDYAGNVQKQREREGVEGEFQTKEVWFEHVTPAIVQHKQTCERYAYVRVLRNLAEPVFTDAEGTEIARATVAPFLPVDDLTDAERAQAGLPAKPANEHQGIEAEIHPIAVKLANVREARIDSTLYTVAREITPARVTRTSPAPAPALHEHGFHNVNAYSNPDGV